MRGVVLGALLAAVIAACAGNKQAAAPMAMDPRKDEITELWMQIRDWRVDNGMSADPMEPVPMSSAVPKLRKCSVDREPTTEVCQDTCNLKDAICDNAERICEIAGELGDDPWANEKCKSGKASCREATEKCCECTRKERSAAPAPARSTDKDVF